MPHLQLLNATGNMGSGPIHMSVAACLARQSAASLPAVPTCALVHSRCTSARSARAFKE